MSVNVIHVILAFLTLLVLALIAQLVRDTVGNRVSDAHTAGRDELPRGG